MKPVLITATLIALAVVGGCNEETAGPQAGIDDVAGYELRSTGGATLYSHTGSGTPSVFNLDAGQSTVVRIAWLDAAGEEIDIDADDHGWDIELVGLASFAGSPVTDWQGTITTPALLPGNSVDTAMRIHLYEGEEPGTDAFTSQWATVRVTS